jgi:uncharacterized repeat protein (TIGR02543 family)
MDHGFFISHFHHHSRGRTRTLRLAGKKGWLIGLLAIVCIAAMPTSTILADAPPVNSWKLVADDVTSNELWKVERFGNRFIAVGQNGTILTSEDGVNWTGETDLITGKINAVAFGTPGYVAVGEFGAGFGKILFSESGDNWEPVDYEDGLKLSDIIWANNMFVAVGDHGTILTSTDGKNWEHRKYEEGTHFFSIAWGNNKFVVVGGSAGNPDRIITSSDGENWGAILYGTQQGYLRSVTWANGKFVAVGANGKVRTSTDGENWTYQSSNFNSELWDVTWGNNQYIAVGSGGNVLTSPDGVQWTVQQQLGSHTLYGISEAGGKYVAVGSLGSIYFGSYAVNDFRVDDGADGGVSSRTVNLEWTAGNDPDAEIIIQQKLASDDDSGWTDAETTTIVTENGSSSTTIINLDPDTEYEFRIKINGEWYDGEAFEDLSNTITIRTKKEHTVSFDKNGGDTDANPDSIAVADGGKVGTLPTPPTKAGHAFEGWNTKEDGTGNAFDGDTVVTESFTVYAQWKINEYTVTFDKNGGDTDANPTTKTVKHGETVDALPTPPTKAGHTFEGWNTKEDGTGNAFDGDTVVTGSVTVYAQWKAIGHTVTFDKNGGDTDANPTTKTVKHGETVDALPTPPTKAGHTFEGWNTKEDGTGNAFDGDTVVTGSVTVYAQWKAIGHTVTFDKNGGDTDANPTTKTVKHGETVDALPTPPTKAGHTFEGWNTKEDGFGNVFDGDTVVTDSVTVYAQWKAIGHTVTFETNGGSPVASVTAEYDTVIAKPANPTRLRYTFKGWFADAALTTPWSFATDTVKGNITLYAKWERDQADVPQEPAEQSEPNEPVESADNGIGYEIIVNGNREDQWARVEVTERDGREIIQVFIDEKQFRERLQKEANGFKVEVPIETRSDISISQLDGELVRIMEQKEVVLQLQNQLAVFTIPAESINILAIADRFGSVSQLEDIKVDIMISTPKADMLRLAEQAASDGGFTIVVPPVEFTVTAFHDGQSIVVDRYPAYVERLIRVPEGVDPARITTAVVVEPSGDVRHVPTVVTVINGVYYAKVNSLTDSMYATIWNPVEFADVREHWSKAAANDMGSRIVVSGTENGLFRPEDAMTRAEFTDMLVQGLGLRPIDGESAFADVSADDGYAGVIHAALAYRLIAENSDGTFRPNEWMTREQAMVLIANAMALTGLDRQAAGGSPAADIQHFRDAAAVSRQALESVAKTVRTGIVVGRNGTALAPEEPVKRAEAVMMIEQLLKKSGLID